MISHRIAKTLFNTLLSWKWSQAIEDEAFSLWLQLADGPKQPEESRSPLMVEVPALYRLVDSMVANRQAAAETILHDAGNVDKLTRTQLAAKKAEFRKQARQGVAARLAAEAAIQSGPLEPWLRIEQAYLDVQLDQRFCRRRNQCWKILGEGRFQARSRPSRRKSFLRCKSSSAASMRGCTSGPLSR